MQHTRGCTPNKKTQKEETMTPETNSSTYVLDPTPRSVSAKDHPRVITPATNPSRCRHLYPNGGRCRIPSSPGKSGLCLSHSRATTAATLSLLAPPSDSEDLSADLLPELKELQEFDAAFTINQFLARLLVLVTKGRITPRRAAVLSYITNQLLHSQRAIQREEKWESERPREFDFSDFPRPDRTASGDSPSPEQPETSSNSAPVAVGN